MRVFKPRNVGLLFRTVERAQRYHFCVAGLLFVPLDATRTLLPEAQMWKAVPKLLGKDAVLDEMVAKTHGELLLKGSVYAPDQKPVPVCVARVQLGPVEKRIVAIGDRVWRRGAPTEPAPFTEMPLDWEHAFGGAGFASNPLGKGYAPIEGPDGKVHPLPNVEYPERLIKSPGDRPAPASFLPLDLTWPERWKKAGTYDRSYLETDFPGLARDADWTMFNTASPDQWAPGHFSGDESFVLENLHPTRRRIEGRLPGAAMRIFIVRKGEPVAEPTSLAMRLETVWFFPDVERAVLIYRGTTDVSEDDADDLEHLLIACEDAAAPKPDAHYCDALAARLDPERQMEAMKREDDFLPAWPATDVAELVDEMAAVKIEGFAMQNQLRKAEREIVQSRAAVAALGLDPDKHGPRSLPAPRKPDEPPKRRADVEREMQEGEAKTRASAQARRARRREQFEKLGLDYSVVEKEMDSLPCGPPKPIADEKLRWLEGMLVQARGHGVDLPDVTALLEDEAFRARLHAMDDAERDSYLLTAHERPAAPRRAPEDSERLRAELGRLRDAGLPVRNLDLTGADLSRLDLSGLDLERAFLEGADLRGANLAGAKLTEAVLTRAKLEGARFDGASLVGANLGDCEAVQASFRECDFERALLVRTNFEGATLDGASLAGADFTEGRFGGASWRGVKAQRTAFIRTNLTGLDFSGADLERANFIEVDAAGANFGRARMCNAGFVTSKVDGASFAGADLTKATFLIDTTAVGANFTGAQALESNYRGTKLDGADFSAARLDCSDFSTCSLRQAKFVGADAKRTRFVRADLGDADLTGVDLAEAVLQKAHLEGAKLDEANLFQADLSLIWGSPETTSKGANFTRTRVHPLRKKK
ncbi:MAG: DUF2169 domain-containing protein [Myxococcales bacterium]|nr:DUF2169 domain-containing protein [Myxococcales bacterium]